MKNKAIPCFHGAYSLIKIDINHKEDVVHIHNGILLSHKKE